MPNSTYLTYNDLNLHSTLNKTMFFLATVKSISGQSLKSRQTLLNYFRLQQNYFFQLKYVIYSREKESGQEEMRRKTPQNMSNPRIKLHKMQYNLIAYEKPACYPQELWFFFNLSTESFSNPGFFVMKRRQRYVR